MAKLDGLTSLAGGLIDDATLASLRAADAADAAANQGILGYHGSPYSFDKFSMDAIGSGEGNQAYGRGLYFAGDESVAAEYRNALRHKNVDKERSLRDAGIEDSLSDESLRTFSSVIYDAANLSPDLSPTQMADIIQGASIEFRSVPRSKIADAVSRYQNDMKGSMYQVRINATDDELLDLFAPLDEQPPGVQAKLEATDWFETVSENLNLNTRDNPYGMELLRYLEDDGPDFAAATLNSAGIKGVKYPDGKSRKRKDGDAKKTSNYVIFDDQYITVARKYGIPLAAMTAAAAPQDAEAGIRTASLSPVLRASMDKVLRGEEVSKSELNSVNKYLGQIAADRTAFGRRERMRMTLGASPDVDVMSRDIITPESMQGEMLVPIQGDASIAGGTLDNVEGVPLDQEIYLQGGPNYPLMNSYGNNLLGWASMRDAAQTKQNQITKAGLLGDDVRGVYARMGDEAMNFNTMVAEAMVRQLPALQLPKKEIARFNKDIRGSVPDFAGVETAEGLAQLKGQLPATKENGKAISSSDLRKLVVGRMSLKKEYGNKGFPNYEDTVRAITEPQLRGLERGDSGFSTIRGMPGANLLDNAYHDTYSHGIPGIYAGGLEESVPLQIMFPDLFRATADKVITKEGSKRFGEPLNAQERVGAVLMGGDSQKADQQWLDGVMKYLEDKKKMGRAAAIAAATSSGNAMAIPPEDIDIQNEIDARRAGSRKYRRDNPPSGLLAAEAQSQALPRAAEAGQGFVSGLLSGLDTLAQSAALPDPIAAINNPQAYVDRIDAYQANQQLPPTQNPNSMMSTPVMRGLLDQQYMADPAERAAFRAPFEVFGGLLAPGI